MTGHRELMCVCARGGTDQPMVEPIYDYTLRFVSYGIQMYYMNTCPPLVIDQLTCEHKWQWTRHICRMVLDGLQFLAGHVQGSGEEVREQADGPTQAPAGLTFHKARRSYHQEVVLIDKNAAEMWSSTHMECRPFKDPRYDLQRLQQDAAVQVPTCHIWSVILSCVIGGHRLNSSNCPVYAHRQTGTCTHTPRSHSPTHTPTHARTMSVRLHVRACAQPRQHSPDF
jgi:hypothetical protein